MTREQRFKSYFKSQMKGEIFLENRCILCGEIVPEGLQVCPACEADILERPSDRIKNGKPGKNGSPIFIEVIRCLKDRNWQGLVALILG
jgi:predicted nucleic acid-binding Zn ribbon protein